MDPQRKLSPLLIGWAQQRRTQVPHQQAYLLTLTTLSVSPTVVLTLLASGQAEYGYMMTGLALFSDSNGDIEKQLDRARALLKETYSMTHAQ